MKKAALRPAFSTATSPNATDFHGLTTREYFAAAALTGISANSALVDGLGPMVSDTGDYSPYAKMAVMMADALIAELDK